MPVASEGDQTDLKRGYRCVCQATYKRSHLLVSEPDENPASKEACLLAREHVTIPAHPGGAMQGGQLVSEWASTKPEPADATRFIQVERVHALPQALSLKTKLALPKA